MVNKTLFENACELEWVVLYFKEPSRTGPVLISTDDGVDAETSLSLSLHLYLSSPPLQFILTLTFGQ